MGKRSGNAINVRRSMLFSLIGRLTQRFVVLESINVIVALCFQGNISIQFFIYLCDFWWVCLDFEVVLFWLFFEGGIALLHTEHFVMPWRRRVLELKLRLRTQIQNQIRNLTRKCKLIHLHRQHHYPHQWLLILVRIRARRHQD